MADIPEVHAAILKPPCAATVISGHGAMLHWHNFPQLWFVRRGELLHVVGKETELARVGSCIFIPAFCPHGTVEATEDSEVVSISFSEELFENAGDDVFLLGDAPYAFGRRVEFFSHFEGKEREALCELVSAIEAECKRASNVRASKLSNLFLQILKRISTVSDVKELTQAERRRINEITEVVAYVAEEISDKLTIDGVCGALKISQSTFVRNFKKVTGMTFVEMVLGMKVRYACLQLARTDKKLVLIASEAGFYDEAHFSHAFSEKMKETPRQYRAKNKTIFDDICIYCEEAPRQIYLTAKREARRKNKPGQNE